MITRHRPSRILLIVPLLAAGALLPALQGCLGARGSEAQEDTSPPVPFRVLIDGNPAEWPADSALLSDDYYLYVRFSPGEEITLQGGAETTVVSLDLDDSATTGERLAPRPDESGGTNPMGVDLEVVFSPRGRGRDGSPAQPQAGVAVHRVSNDGRREPINHAAAGLVFAPTYAADQYELRLLRSGIGLSGASAVRARIVAYDATGATLGWSDPISTVVSASNVSAWTTDADLPVRATDELRVVSLNVEFASPMRKPGPFARLFRALDPDIILACEWEKVDAQGLVAWFDEHVPTQGGWHAVTSAGWGVAVVSRYPLDRFGPQRIEPPTIAGEPNRPDARTAEIESPAVRFVGALVNWPGGPIAVGAAHLKCCGSKGTWQDEKRIAEAELINLAVRDALISAQPVARVLGGDLNLVGTRTPLDRLRQGLDADGSDLEVAQPRVLGDAAMYTWGRASERFSAGRLDYVCYSGSTATVARTFVLDTGSLSDAALLRAGLDRSDSSATDHRAVVLDLRVRGD
ncbi:MAG: endonuclease/exonuclease/phosphatase family protein [Phycisphaerae bacterium]|nr:endonuclease/exonuclease/phosphatase family protein [Phycisphaerae bacterium]